MSRGLNEANIISDSAILLFYSKTFGGGGRVHSAWVGNWKLKRQSNCLFPYLLQRYYTEEKLISASTLRVSLVKILLRVVFCIKTDQISPDIFSLECGYNLAWLGVAGRRTAHASQGLYEWPLILPVVPSGNRHHALCDVSCRRLYTGWSTSGGFIWSVFMQKKTLGFRRT